MATDVENVLQHVNIADVIGRYIEIQKKGTSYVAVCPFHDDSSPSLNISVEKKIFKCFACGVGGNALTFVQRFKAISFPEALAEVGKIAGVTVNVKTNFAPKYNNQEQKVISINNDALNYFATLLYTTHGTTARKYLQTRNIEQNQIRFFDIGFAKAKNKLFDFLKNNRGYSEKEISDSALFHKKGLTFVPIFYNRLMFPIRNFNGDVIGFSGRKIDDGDGPKYLNTSENILFKKSHLAYNYSNAESAIRIKDQIIILEGYMDVISLFGVDIKNVVAIMGTSLSDFQIKQFQKITKNFVIFLDGDEPGINAAIKVAKQLIPYGINIKIVYNESGMDPDELIQAGQKNKVEKMIVSAKSPSDFVLEIIKAKKKVTNTIEELLNLMHFGFDMIVHIEGATIPFALDKMAAILETDLENVKNEFQKFKSTMKPLSMQVTEKKEDNDFLPSTFHEPTYDDLLPEPPDVSDFEFQEFQTVAIPPQLPKPLVPIAYLKSVWYLAKALLDNDEFAIKNKNISSVLEPPYNLLIQKIIELKMGDPLIDVSQFVTELRKPENKFLATVFSHFKNINNFEKRMMRPVSQRTLEDSFHIFEDWTRDRDVNDLKEMVYKLTKKLNELEKKGNVKDSVDTKQLLESIKALIDSMGEQKVKRRK